MSDKTGIGWTDATWNPVTGCSHVSEGCRYCYAEALSLRFGRSTLPWTARNAAVNVVTHPGRLMQPRKWAEPRRVFVNSMSDLFHELIPTAFLDQVVGVMGGVDRHIYQVLTKRPARMKEYVWDWVRRAATGWPRNVWLGTSVENQSTANERIPQLQGTPAVTRFLSLEPLLGPVDLSPYMVLPGDCARIDWVIVGGESGPHHRPMRIEWLEQIVTEAQSWGVRVFVKQDSGRFPGKQGRIPDDLFVQEFPGETPQLSEEVVR